MAYDDNIKTFTAADIERYHKGLLTAREMHEMEKAALEDPFLADAMEGYAVEGVNVSEDIAELRERLQGKKDEAKVIPMSGSTTQRFRWWKVAAAVVILGGGAVLVQQFQSSHKNESIAKSESKDRVTSPVANNTAEQQVSPDSGTTSFNYTPPGAVAPTAKAVENKQQKQVFVEGNVKPGEVRESEIRTDDLVINNERDQQATATVPRVEEKLETSAGYQAQVKKEKEDAQRFLNETASVKSRRIAGAPQPQRDAARYGNALPREYSFTDTNYGRQKNSQGIVQTRVFRGRVTDEQNNALPFANITNPADNVGTYTDANGNFVLISPDSLLNVQVRSIGFENNVVQLNSSLRDNQVVLSEDRSLSARVLDTTRFITNRSRTGSLRFEEPEPEDGWSNYDTYIANNTNRPSDFKPKDKVGGREVELSFEVNKLGQPVKIKVVRSLCESCDKEAIRLLKEGPKWKPGNKRKRTTVTVTL